MIDLATTVGVDQPTFLPEGSSFHLERHADLPFVDSSTVTVTERGGLAELPAESPYGRFADHNSAFAILDKIVDELRRTAERFPWSARARADLGLALLNRGKLEEAPSGRTPTCTPHS
jgi:hypothetical protein